MSTIETAWKYFLIYRGLNLHYKDNSKYDYSKYGPMSKGAKADQFEHSADRYVFIKLANTFPKEDDYIDYLHWRAWKEGQLPYFRNLTVEPVINTFKSEYLKTKTTFKYHFSVWLESMELSYLKTNGEDHPQILNDLLTGEIHIDFYFVLDKKFDLTKKYLEIFEKDLLLQAKLNKYKRYRMVAKVNDFETLSKLISEHIRKVK